MWSNYITRFLDVKTPFTSGRLGSSGVSWPWSSSGAGRYNPAVETKPSDPKKLTGRQNRYLRGLGHHLSPVVMIGRDGVTDPLVKATEIALEAHELIKVKVQEGCVLTVKTASQVLADQTRSAVAQVLGKTFLLYRESKKKKITLP